MKTLALLVCVALGGCVVVDHHGVGGGVPAGAPVSLIRTGAGVPISPGSMAGYGITANTGTSFRLVWTGDAGAVGGYREFWGSVWTPGIFDNVYPGCIDHSCALEGDDYLSGAIPVNGGERIDFDTFATVGIDGFDFTATAEPIYFDLLIDGVRYPTAVVFTDGSTNALASAPSIPFGLRTQ